MRNLIIAISLAALIAGGYFLLPRYYAVPVKEIPLHKISLSLPELVVNLKKDDSGQSHLLKMTMMVTILSAKEKEFFDPFIPYMVDQSLSFLRELQLNDTDGGKGSEMIREGLKKRFDLIITPHKVDNVLIQEILTQ